MNHRFPLSAVAAAALVLAAGNARAEDLEFTLTNATSGTIVMFHTSPVGVDEWEEDVLGDQVLGAGESATVVIADGRDVCEYDMRFEFAEEDGLETLEDSQDLCELGAYTVEE